jgi:hypothetical protein
MQIPGQVQVPSLPSPPLLQRLTLEEPGTLTVAFVVAAAIGFYVLNRQGKASRGFLAAAIGVGLAIGVQVLARLIETDRERIMGATAELVRTTAHADVEELSKLLAKEVRFSNDFDLTNSEVQTDKAWDRDEILAKVREYMTRRYALKEAAILETQGIIDRPGVGRTQVRVRAVPEAAGFPIISWWRIDWVKKDDGWVVKGIQPMDLGLGGMGG